METQNNWIPRALIVQDLSCLGRCSLTVALPALSSLGVQAVPLPTAALSAHTGGFGRPAAVDLTGFMKEAIAHYRSLDLRFDAVVTGYMASCEQVQIARELLAWQRQALKVVDPAMADHGHLYQGLPKDLPGRLRSLCGDADLITPNWTEACLLAGAEYSDAPLSPEALRSLCSRLPAREAVVTGAPFGQGTANAVFSRGEVTIIPYELLPAAYPGTGDLFTACLTGRLLQGMPLTGAARETTRFLSSVIALTLSAGTPAREGVLLERCLCGKVSGH